MTMNIYRISQSVNHHYDTYDSAIVAAPDEDVARRMHPERGLNPPPEWIIEWGNPMRDWADPESVTVERIGTTPLYDEPCVILASFNAG